jgi:hypothetical protein
VPNPTSGAVLVTLVGLVPVWVTARMVKAGAVPLVLVLAAVVHLGVLRLATKNDDHDVAARRFLTSVWLAPAGKQVQF